MQPKQLDKMISKVMNITSIYQTYIVDSEINIVDATLDSKPIKKGTLWGRDFKYGLFSFKVPKLDPNKKYYLTLSTGATDHLIMLNNREIGLIDYVPNSDQFITRLHKYVLLENLKEGDKVDIRAYFSHHFPGTFPYDKDVIYGMSSNNDKRPYEYIKLVTMDEDLKELVFKLNYLNQLYWDSKTNKEKEVYTNLYKDLFICLSMRPEKPSKEVTNKGLKILTRLDNLSYKDLLPYVGIIGHSHLDTAWLWTVNETREKMHRTISNAVTLLKRHKEYKFFFSTVLYLEWLKEDDIVLYKEVIELIKDGRIEANGGSFIEFDSNLIGNESICRQFLRGKRFMLDEASFDMDTFWLPDTFGYSASLPQILKEVGIKYFLTTKLSWNDTNTFPYDTFNWIGIDGSKVIVHFNTIPGEVTPKIIEDRINGVIDKTTTTDVLISYGYGDGGGGPSEEVVNEAILVEKNYKKANVKHATVSSFMDRISKKDLPSYFGELYLELHRGTYTSIHNIKKYHKELETTLHDFELVDVLSGSNNIEKSNKAYDTIMLNEFHDILPGTCIKEQNEITVNELKGAINELNSLMLDKKGNYFNPLFKSRYAYLDSKSGQEYLDLDSKKKHLNLFYFDGLSYGKQVRKTSELDGDLTHFKNKYFSGVIENGLIKSLNYNGYELVDGSFSNYKVSVNYPLIYDNWDIDRDYKFKEEDITFLKQELISKGDKALIYRVSNKFHNSFITTDIYIYSDSPLIEFKNKMVINDDHLVLRTYFNTSVFSEYYSSEIQFGNIKRSSYNKGPQDEAKFESCSHKYLDLSDGTYGITLLKKDLYGSSCDNKTIGLTLHKGGTHPDPSSDKGTHYFEYALYPHLGPLSMDIIDKAYEYNFMPIKTTKEMNSNMFKLVNSSSCVIETVKYAIDGGVILRIYESLGKTSSFEMTFDKAYNIYDANILENVKEEFGKLSELKLTFKPFEIKTILIK